MGDALGEVPNAFVLDPSVGWGRRQTEASTRRFRHAGKVAFTTDVLVENANDTRAALSGLLGLARKLIVVDLDDTLWGGIVGDVGWETLRLGGHDPSGDAFVQFQRRRIAPAKRGIALAVVNIEQTVHRLAERAHPRCVILFAPPCPRRCPFITLVFIMGGASDSGFAETSHPFRAHGRMEPEPPAGVSEDAATNLASRARALAGRVVRVGLNEARIHPRQTMGSVVSRAFPRFSFNRTRTALLRALGVRIGARSLVLGGVDISGPGDATELLCIGDDSCITGPLYVDLGAAVHIGNGVQLGHHVTLLTLDHRIGPSGHRCGAMMSGPIAIGDGAWIGSRVTILPGVSVGAGAVVATGAVVVHDVAADMLVAGVPARIIRKLDHGVPASGRRRLSPFVPPRER